MRFLDNLQFGRCRGGGLSCGLTGEGAHRRSDLVPIGQIIQPPLLLYNFVDLSGIFPAVWNQHIYLRISRLWYQRGGFDDGPVKSTHMVMTDEKGNHANEMVPNEVIDMFVDTLNERNLYKHTRIYVRQWKARIRYGSLDQQLSITLRVFHLVMSVNMLSCFFFIMFLLQ
nr:uncharacterized protein LOC120974846 isoform X1 [Aegilops tauschii subsp. strangulata]